MLEVMEEAARRAGDVIKNYFRGDYQISDKTSHKDLLTEADLQSQRVIQEKLTDGLRLNGVKMSEIGFIAEENLNIAGSHQFIIDPLDGTSNFASGVEFFAISIAHLYQNQIIEGVIYDPIRDNLFSARRGEGAFKKVNGKIEKLSIKKQALRDLVIDVSLSVRVGDPYKLFEIYKKLTQHVRKLRSFGSIALNLCLTADSVFGAVLRKKSMVWDIAAGDLIVREAGGVLTDWQGKDLVYDFANPKKPYEFIAGHRDTISEIIKIINNDRK